MSRNIPSDAVNHGRNAENPTTGLRDDRYVRCKNCGFICHLDRDIHHNRGSQAGDGVTRTAITATGSGQYWNDTLETWTDSGYDVTVSSGCPMCGTLLYNE